MNKQLSCVRMALVAVLLGSASFADTSDARRVLADFESLSSGDVIAPGAGETSKPWRRFGEATSDNILATTATSKVLSGSVSATYPLAWPARFGAALMVSDQPLDLSGYKTADLMIKSSQKGTATKVLLQISDRKTTFTSKTPQKITDQSTTLSFELQAKAMELVDGPRADFASVLHGVKLIGFKVISDGSKYSENVVFDNLSVDE